MEAIGVLLTKLVAAILLVLSLGFYNPNSVDTQTPPIESVS